MMGGFKVQGNTAAVAKRLYDEALALEDAGSCHTARTNTGAGRRGY